MSLKSKLVIYFILLSVPVAGHAASLAEDAKESGKETVQTIKQAGTDIKEGAQKVGKETKEALKKAGKEIKQDLKNAGHETKQGFKKAGQEIKSAVTPDNSK